MSRRNRQDIQLLVKLISDKNIKIHLVWRLDVCALYRDKNNFVGILINFNEYLQNKEH